MRTMSLTFVAGAALLALPVPAFAGGSAAGPIPSTIEIDDYRVDGDEVVLGGAVSSPRRSCERGRKVAIVGYDALLPPRVIGTDRTGRRGRFEVREPIPLFEDFAYPKVKRKRLRTGRICKVARGEDLNTSGRAAGQVH